MIKNLKAPFLDPPTPEDLIPEFSVHEQRDGVIYGMCITGSNSKQSLLSWIRFLESHGNSRLEDIPILFRDSLPLDTKPKREEEKIQMLSEGAQSTS